MATYYASASSDWTLYIGPVTDAAAVGKLIERAEDDIDAVLGAYTIEANGRKLGSPKSTNEKQLSTAQKAALAKATCLQGDYRARLFPGGEDGHGWGERGWERSRRCPARTSRGRTPGAGAGAGAGRVRLGCLRGRCRSSVMPVFCVVGRWLPSGCS
jgi:hypothetical protein